MKIRDSEMPRGTDFATAFSISLLFGVALPFAALTAAGHYGLDFSRDLYIALLSAVAANAALILLAPFLRLAGPRPADLAVPYPPASSLVICDRFAHPELAQDTIDTLLRLPYPGPFQVIVLHAYPDPEFEAHLDHIARRHRNLHSVCVSGDPASRENLNLALNAASGEIVACFRAGQRPLPGSFARAWDWISSGADALGGRYMASSGESSWLSRLEAVDLASSSSPGVAPVLLLSSLDSLRAGNTYWKMTVARRLVADGPEQGLWKGRRAYRGVFAPDVLTWHPIGMRTRQLWRSRILARMGWQSLPAAVPLRRLPGLAFADRVNLYATSVWRPGYVWLTAAIFGLTAYWSWKIGSVRHWSWFVPLGILLLLLAVLEPTLRTVLAALGATRALRRHPLWFVEYLIVSILLYGALKSLADRAAELGVMFGRQRKPVSVPHAAVTRAEAPLGSAAVLESPEQAGPKEPEPEEDEEIEDIVAEHELPPPIDLQAVMAAMMRDEERRAVNGEHVQGDSPFIDIARPETPGLVEGRAVIEAAAKLGSMVDDLVVRLDREEAENRRLRARLASVEGGAAPGMESGALCEVRDHPIAEDELNELLELMNSLTRNPGHIVVLANISQHADAIVDVIGRYARVQADLLHQSAEAKVS